MQLGMHGMDIPCLRNLNYLVMGEIINITIFTFQVSNWRMNKVRKNTKKGENTNSRRHT